MSIIKTTDPVYFNGIDFNSIPGWMTTATDTYRYPSRRVSNFGISHTDKGATTSAFFDSKKLNISGIIAVEGRELLDDSISQLRKIVKPINKQLQLPISGKQRIYYEVTAENIVIANVKGGLAQIDIEFVTADPFNYDTVTTELLNIVNLTSGNKSYPVTVEGTAMQCPVITYTIDSLTSGSLSDVIFSNPDGNSITINRIWTAAEVLVIDCLNGTVEVDDVAVVYSGRLPMWESGNQYVNYTDEFTARQVDINVTYRKRYE